MDRMTKPRTRPERDVSLAELTDFPAGRPEQVQPTSLTLDLTHCCPFRCPACIEGKAMRHSRRTALRADTACRLIAQFAEQGGEEVLLYGGEPTLHPQFPQVLQYAASCLRQIKVVTNGAFLEKPPVAESLLAAAEEAWVSVRVSLNAGTSRTHERLHRAPGVFFPIIQGMKGLTVEGSHVRLGVSYLLEEANAHEVLQAYELAGEVGAADFWLRPKTGLHGIGMLPLSRFARAAVREAVEGLRKRLRTHPGPVLHVEPWYVRFLETNRPPDTAKTYSACYYCGAARLVITPPEPGVVWSCTYWRADPRFHVADLGRVPFGSPEFEQCRLAAIRRIDPRRDCAKVICNRHKANQAIWKQLMSIHPTRVGATHASPLRLQIHHLRTV